MRTKGIDHIDDVYLVEADLLLSGQFFWCGANQYQVVEWQDAARNVDVESIGIVLAEDVKTRKMVYIEHDEQVFVD